MFTNRASIAYASTVRSSRNNRGTTNLELRRRRSGAVADSHSINDALHPNTSHQLYNIMSVSLLRPRDSVSISVLEVLSFLDRHDNHG
jgi:hypothetical protein